MAPTKTLYVKESDLPLWEEAETFAQAHSQSVSVVVANALRSTLPALKAADTDGDYERLEVGVGEDRSRTEAFLGRWLVPPESDLRSGVEGADAGACYGVALTAKGSIAWYVYHVNDRWPASLNVSADLSAARSDGLPDDIADEAAGEMGEVIWRDI